MSRHDQPRRTLWTLFGLALLGATGCAPAPEPADLLLVNGKLVTMDPSLPEATALASRGGLIVAVGTDEEVRRFSGPETEVIDLEGRLAVPGFIEGHAHFSGLGRSLINIDLRSEPSWEAIVARLQRAAERADPGQWILGWGWHQEKWDSQPQPNVEGYPTRQALDQAVPDNPVLLRHAAGSHGVFVNRAALEAAGIGDDTADPPGGRIQRDARGRATGVLFDNAFDLVDQAYDAAQAALGEAAVESLARQQLELANEECLSKGVTSFQDAGTDFETVDRLLAMAERGDLGVRLWVMLNEETDRIEESIADYRMVGAADGHVTVRAIKRVADGALGSHSAWLLEPYTDLQDNVGLNTDTIESVERTARLALEHDLQLCVHAIGDRANRETLDLYERMFEKRTGADLRWRIEHAQHLSVEDIPRFADLGVIASMQGIHCTSDAPWVPLRLGDERAEQGAYVWRKLIDSGATISNGTDAPVEDVDPIANFYATVTRRTTDGNVFYPDQRMTRMEALQSATLNAAYAAFEEDVKGSLTVGKLADVVVLSHDIMTLPEEEIRNAEILYTIVGGRILFSAPAS